MAPVCSNASWMYSRSAGRIGPIRTPDCHVKPMSSPPVTKLVLLRLALGLTACSDPAADAEQISPAIESHDEIVTKNGRDFLTMDLINMFDLSVLP